MAGSKTNSPKKKGEKRDKYVLKKAYREERQTKAKSQHAVSAKPMSNGNGDFHGLLVTAV
jgi:hypothetical protein